MRSWFPPLPDRVVVYEYDCQGRFVRIIREEGGVLNPGDFDWPYPTDPIRKETPAGA